MEERENLAREAFNNLSKIPESADLPTVCKRFEDLRFVTSTCQFVNCMFICILIKHDIICEIADSMKL